MLQDGKIWMAQGDNPCYLQLDQANRHGLIAGASGTGKTVTLKVMAEGFSQAGVPVFMADVKGDVTGMAQPGDDTEGIRERVERFGIEGWSLQGCPVHLWDMIGGEGIPVRITVSDMGPVMLARLLGLTDAQEGVLNIAFRMADDRQMLLIDLKDLRAMLNYVGEHAKELELEYGRVSSQSVGAILRELIAIEDQGGGAFFGEPALDLADWFATTEDGQGVVNILAAAKLMESPQVYAMFLLWMLSELFQTLPEVGDLAKPKLVFFFDEAHLLFDGMPKELTDRLVQVVKLIRSKGVGVYFITQSPSDIPDEVLAQLSNRIQHGLRAYTPDEQKAVRAAARAFRANPAFDAAEALLEVGTGEALVSLLNGDGQPSVVERAKVLPPQCLMAAASPETMAQVVAVQAPLQAKYGEAVDRESAYELISAQKAAVEEAEAAEVQAEELAKAQAAAAKEAEKEARAAEREAQRLQKEAERQAQAAERAAQKQRDQAAKTMSSIIGQIGREAGRQLVRGLFGGLRR